jgi:hypothetical protein
MNFIKYFYNIFAEARDAFKPKQPKQTVLSILEKYKDDPDILISFRDNVQWISEKNPDIKKTLSVGIGINPNNRYGTPTGIYGYVLQPMWQNFKRKSIPFAGDRPVIVVYKPDLKDGEKIARSSDFKKEQLEQVFLKLKNMYYYTDDDLQHLLDQIEDYYKDTAFKTLWSLTRKIAIQDTNNNRYVSGIERHVNYWSNLLIKLGYPIIIDDVGTGTIHSNEPTQSVVFGRRFVKVLETIENKNWQEIDSSNTVGKLLSKITDYVFVNSNLGKWSESIKNFNTDVKNKIFMSLLKSNNLQYLSEKDVQNFKPETFLNDKSYKNITDIYDLTKNNYLINYLFKYLDYGNVCEFLIFFISSSKADITESQMINLIKACYKNIPTQSIDGAIRNIKQIIDDKFNYSIKVKRTFIYKTLEKISKNFGKSENTSQEKENLVLISNRLALMLYDDSVIKSDDVVWKVLNKKLDSTIFIDALSNAILERVRTGHIYRNLQEKIPSYIIKKIESDLNKTPPDSTSSVYYSDFFYNNQFLLNSLNINWLSNLFVANCLENYKSGILDLIVKQFNRFSPNNVKENINYALETFEFLTSEKYYISNFEKLNESIKKFITSDYNKVVEILIKSAFKNNYSVGYIKTLMGDKNFNTWLEKNKDSIESNISRPIILNDIDSELLFNNQYNIKVAIDDYSANNDLKMETIYDYIYWFVQFNQQLREKIINKINPSTLYSNKIVQFDQIDKEFDFKKVLSFVHDMLKKEQYTVQEIVQNLNKDFLNSEKTKKYFSNIIQQQKQSFFSSLIKDLLPINNQHNTSKRFLQELFQDVVFFEYDASRHTSLSTPVFLRKDDYEKVLQTKVKLSVLDFDSFMQNIKLSLSNYSGKYQVDSDVLIACANNKESCLFLKDYNVDAQDIYVVENDVPVLNDQGYEQYPFYIKTSVFLDKFKNLPELETPKPLSREKGIAISKHGLSQKNSDRIVQYDGETYIWFPKLYIFECGLNTSDLYINSYGLIKQYTAGQADTYIKLTLWTKLFGNLSEISVEQFIETHKNCPKELLPLLSFDVSSSLAYIGRYKDISDDVSLYKESLFVYDAKRNVWIKASVNNEELSPQSHVAVKKSFFNKNLIHQQLATPELYKYNLSGTFNLFYKNNLQQIIYNAKNQQQLMLQELQMTSANFDHSKLWKSKSPDEIIIALYKGFTFNNFFCLSDYVEMESKDLYSIDKDSISWYNYSGSCDEKMIGIKLSDWETFTGLKYVDVVGIPAEIKEYFEVDQNKNSQIKNTLLTNYDKIPLEIKQNKPTKTMFGETPSQEPLVYLGNGISKGWSKYLNVNAEHIYIFNVVPSNNNNNTGYWVNGYSGNIPVSFYALKRSVWEHIVGKKVPEEYYKDQPTDQPTDEQDDLKI